VKLVAVYAETHKICELILCAKWKVCNVTAGDVYCYSAL